MENQRIFFAIALSIAALFLFFAWEAEQHEAGDDTTVVEEEVEEADAPDRPDAPEEQISAPPAEEDAPEADELPQEDEGQRVVVRTDLLEAELSTKGGDIRQLDLLRHARARDDDTPFRLMRDDGEPFFVAQSGVQSDAGGPDHRSLFQTEETEYELAEGEDTLEVPLYWEEDGVEVRKVYTFYRDQYVVDLRHEVRNARDESWRGYSYVQLRRADDPPGTTPWYIHTYTGGVYFTPDDRYERVSFSDMESSDLSRDVTDGWAAMIQHYFLGAILPPRGEQHRYFTRALPGEHYLLGMSSPWQSAEANGNAEFRTQLFLGPKEQKRLNAVAAEDLRLTVDYGFLTILANPLFWLLDNIHNYVGNWGWSIILLTLLIKLAFYKLSAISYRSMANMRRVQPQMQTLRERYGDDRQQMNQKLMELYKKEKINPLGGCLPILVQIPVFIALYWVLLESVELRHAPFMLWIDDLSSRDPYFVLPVLMGLTMFLQMQLNPAPMDPIQKRVMQVLPFIFTGFFMLFPAGLVLYWLANNILSIAQQWFIMRSVDQGQGTQKT